MTYDRDRLAALRHIAKNDKDLDRDNFWKTDHVKFLLDVIKEQESGLSKHDAQWYIEANVRLARALRDARLEIARLQAEG